ncbi:cyclic nucleotide-binding domain-containing protein [Fundidesulfovibrio magnetotacticus]|uniref:cyclic nucleotide-binding domain-containing protein n=1 Tax=Fundidesulfovibrio magnetotacticus TaxID=2730080 RepID=UPI00156452D3|nr:cyclic nucleotide-binding domain-containing protein [Fundidesulfovibrio magnetotacticus]
MPDRTARAALLEQTRLARGMDWRSLLVLGQSMTYREVSAGSFLYQEGEPGEELAVLLSGVLTVVKRDSEGQDARVGEIHARAVVGEMSLLDGGPRSASVYAQTPAALLALNRRALERLLEAHPRVGTRLLAALAAEVSQRLRLATGRLARRGGGDAFALEDV